MRRLACLVLGLTLAFSPALVAAQQTVPPPPRPTMPSPGGAVRDGQQEKTGTAVLSGRVTDGEAGKPLRRALVRAMSQELPQGRSISTDADGRWQLKMLPAGSYRVLVSKGGYVDISYGQKRPFESGKTLELTDGQTIDKLDVALPRAGVITGRVFDEFGEPVTGARVTVQRYRYAAGQRRLVAMGPGDTTDDIGQYRLHGLSPGEYYVNAGTPGMMMMLGQSDDRVGYASTFYPGTALPAEAQRVTVTVGKETQQVDITMAQTRIATVSGTAVSASGAPIARGMLSLSAMSPTGGGITSFGTSLRPDGTFVFSNVSPGEYRITVQHSATSNEPFLSSMNVTESGSVTINVSGRDITGLSIVTSPGGTASGRVVFEGTAKPPLTPQALNIVAMPVELMPMMGMGSARVRDDYTFEASGLSERRRFRVNSPTPGWYLKSVTHDGTDITDSGFEFKEGQSVSGIEIVMTQRVSELTGTVQDAHAKPLTDYVVVAFSTDSSKWGNQTRFVRAIRPNQDGRFSVKALPADDYFVVALDYLEMGEESDPEQLEKWKSAANRVTLVDGEQKTVTLKLSQ